MISIVAVPSCSCDQPERPAIICSSIAARQSRNCGRGEFTVLVEWSGLCRAGRLIHANSSLVTLTPRIFRTALQQIRSARPGKLLCLAPAPFGNAAMVTRQQYFRNIHAFELTWPGEVGVLQEPGFEAFLEIGRASCRESGEV